MGMAQMSINRRMDKHTTCIHLDNPFNFFGRKIQEKNKQNGVLNMLLNCSWIFRSGVNL